MLDVAVGNLLLTKQLLLLLIKYDEFAARHGRPLNFPDNDSGDTRASKTYHGAMKRSSALSQFKWVCFCQSKTMYTLVDIS